MDAILSPLEAGSSVATYLVGVISVQMYLYYREHPEDPMEVKVLVAAIWLIENASQMCINNTIHFYTIEQFGNFNLLSAPIPKSTGAFILFHGLTVLLISGFYVYRLLMNTEKRLIATFLGALVLARSSLLFVFAGFTFISGNFTEFLQNSRTMLVVTLAVVVVTQICLTSALCHDLHLGRQSPIYRTCNLYERFTMWWIMTGLSTSVLAVMMLISFFVASFSEVWLGIFIVLPRVTAIAYLASMSARRVLRDGNTSDTYQVELESRATRAGHRSDKADQRSPVHVMIVKETAGNGDPEDPAHFDDIARKTKPI